MYMLSISNIAAYETDKPGYIKYDVSKNDNRFVVIESISEEHKFKFKDIEYDIINKTFTFQKQPYDNYYMYIPSICYNDKIIEFGEMNFAEDVEKSNNCQRFWFYLM